jgi:hypothetical protein
VFHIKKPKKVTPNIFFPFFAASERIIFSIAISIGPKPIKSKNVLYGIGGHASHNNKPERIDRKIFFFISSYLSLRAHRGNRELYRANLHGVRLPRCARNDIV